MVGRKQKVSQALKRELSSIIQRELKDPRLGFLTITRVEMSPDLRLAKVYFSVLGDEKKIDSTKCGLDSALGYIRRLIGQRLRLRYTPEIHFRFDQSPEYSLYLDEALKNVDKGP